MSRCRHPAAGGGRTLRCGVERAGSSFAFASAAECCVVRHWARAARDIPGCDRLSGPRRPACAAAGRRQALAAASHCIAIRDDPRGHVQPAAADRHQHSASADLCPGEFRPGRYYRLDRQAVARRSDGADSVSETQSQGQARLPGRAPARSDAAVAAGACYRVRAAGRGRRHTQEG